ncbi:MAG: Gfo/Idh/MocA family oxidoreductase [Chloroflexota bacterium]|nr:Gfo/Idh/MocA family oxidoreductase [Chloroflexota bacterium]
MTPIRCAVLGTGHSHALGKLNVMRNFPEWDLVGVCEPDDSWRQQRQQEESWQGLAWLEEAEVLDDPTIQMIAVESEVPQLLPLGEKAIAAGKHIHLDKPAGMDLPRWRALLDKSEQQGLIIQMGYMFRYNPGFNLVRQAVSEGWLGDVHYVRGGINSASDSATRERLSHYPGGIMLELGCHLLDMITLIMGRPEKVTSILREDGDFDVKMKDNTVAVMEYEKAVGIIESSLLEQGSKDRRHFAVCGSEGSIVLTPLEPPAGRLFLNEPRGGYQAGWQDVPFENIPRYEHDLVELAACIRGEMEFPYSKEHDYITQETVLRACGAKD